MFGSCYSYPTSPSQICCRYSSRCRVAYAAGGCWECGLLACWRLQNMMENWGLSVAQVEGGHQRECGAVVCEYRYNPQACRACPTCIGRRNQKVGPRAPIYTIEIPSGLQCNRSTHRLTRSDIQRCWGTNWRAQLGTRRHYRRGTCINASV